MKFSPANYFRQSHFPTSLFILRFVVVAIDQQVSWVYFYKTVVDKNSLDQSSSLKLNISILLRRDVILYLSYSRTNFMCKCIEIVDIRFSYSNTFQCKYTLLVLKLINHSSTHYKHKIITMQQTYSCAHKDILEIRCDCNAYTVSNEENNPFRPGNLHN